MPVIELDSKDDRRLESVAPDYLKGCRKIGRRVQWAVDEFLKLQSSGNGKVAERSDDKSSPTGALHADGLAARTRQAEAVSE